MLHKTRGIVLHSVKYSETSLIVKTYTEAFGIQSYMVKGVRSHRSKMRPILFQPLTLLDMVVWALVALTIQVLVFLGLRLFIGDLAKEIADDRPAPAILLAVLSLAAGIINAACMTY